MNIDMYPLKFKPILKPTIWGGEKIIPYKGLDSKVVGVGESWELSGVKGNESVVENGALAGMGLSALLAREGAALLGRENYARFGNEFPLLVKFIDAQADLSIQVHPNDALAWERHRSKGKTEMWYVVDAEPGAHLRSGFARQVSPSEYEKAVDDGSIEDLLADYQIKPGDVFFLPAGRVHSIGAGAFIAEIQQTSDITYRIYDFGRRDAEGKLRELHTALAKDAIDYSVLPDYRTHYERKPDEGVVLAAIPYFTTVLYELTADKVLDYSGLDSFVVVICMQGEGCLQEGDGEALPVRQGDTVLLPATADVVKIKPERDFKMLSVYIDPKLL